MKMVENKELMIMRAKEFAQSGDYSDSTLIEIALRGEFPNASQWLTRFARQELDEMCRQAQDRANGLASTK